MMEKWHKRTEKICKWFTEKEKITLREHKIITSIAEPPWYTMKTVTEWPERVTDGWKLAQNYKKYFENEQKGTHTMLCKSFEPAVISLYFCFQGARLSVSGPVVLKTLWRFSSVFLLATFPLIFNPVQSPKYFGGLSLLSHLKSMNYEHRKAPSDFDPLCNTIW